MMRDILHAIALKAIESSKPVQLVEAEVIAAPPELKIKVAGNDKLEIPKELIVVSEYLCKHKRKVNLINSNNTNISATYPNQIVADSYPKIVASNSIDFHHLSMTKADFDLKEGEFEFLDELKVGDKVMCAVIQGGQLFYIFDRIVTYE
jgi:hypothetical protein